MEKQAQYHATQSTMPALPAFQLGPTSIAAPVVLAPMSGYNDQPFRRLCRRFGAALVYTGLLSSNAIVYGPGPFGNPATAEMLRFHPDEFPVVCQLFGNDDTVIVEAARKVASLGMTAIDINLGCATPKVAGSGAGASLLRDPAGIARLFARLTQAIDLPVSGKIRLGWDAESLNYLEVAQALADNGAALIAVHGRTAVQGYEGWADWGAIAEVKRAVAVPVLASGDVRTASDIGKVLEVTGCDGVMIGRGAIGNMWIFEGRHRDEIPWPERVPLIQEHLSMMVAFHGEYRGVHQFRKHLRAYLPTSGVARRDRARMMDCNDSQTLLRLLSDVSYRPGR